MRNKGASQPKSSIFNISRSDDVYLGPGVRLSTMRLCLATAWILVFLCLPALPLKAKHIVGGDLQYECLGGGRYRITMKIYRDCRPQEQAAPLDGLPGDPLRGALVAVYRGTSNFQLVQQLAVPVREQRPIEAPSFPCLIPPEGLCVEEGIYVFDITISDWPSTESYHIVYQRCCRNNTISNLVAPGDAGASYWIEIAPEAQATCNNSPVFNSFPPTVICVDNEFNFDHSARDAEGDSLVYSFCSPLLGGGLAGGPDFPFASSAGCDGIRPNPPCRPPYGAVVFSSGYSVSTPLAGDPVVSIDPQTGVITGTPQVIGQFVVGVCVEEYRNGEKIGEIRRDFQFNVADCAPTVFARVKSDARVGDREFVINSCGVNTIRFENESQLIQFIEIYRWEFDIGGNITAATTRDAEITFPGVGTYRGVMMVNPGLPCGDTAEIFVNLYPSIRAEFVLDHDTCVPGPVIFGDRSVTGADRIERWDWSFGDGGTSDRQHPTFNYERPGDYQVTLAVTDNNECVDRYTVLLRYYPVPALIIVEPSTFVGCAPASILFNNLSSPIDSTYQILWTFGDGSASMDISPVHIYEDIGVFSVDVEITSPIGCFTSASFPNWITIRESPEAAFSFSPDQPSNFNPTVTFTNQSVRHVAQQWMFDAAGASQEENPVFTFPDTGLYQVQLVAIHPNGCRDTALQEIHVLPIVTYHMPNAFTPNGDGRNDLFVGQGHIAGMRAFEMTIWSRWGELLFETADPTEGWNGLRNNRGDLLPNGVYVYQVRYIEPRGKHVELRGYATLIR